MVLGREPPFSGYYRLNPGSVITSNGGLQVRQEHDSFPQAAPVGSSLRPFIGLRRHRNALPRLARGPSFSSMVMVACIGKCLSGFILDQVVSIASAAKAASTHGSNQRRQDRQFLKSFLG